MGNMKLLRTSFRTWRSTKPEQVVSEACSARHTGAELVHICRRTRQHTRVHMFTGNAAHVVSPRLRLPWRASRRELGEATPPCRKLAVINTLTPELVFLGKHFN